MLRTIKTNNKTKHQSKQNNKTKKRTKHQNIQNNKINKTNNTPTQTKHQQIFERLPEGSCQGGEVEEEEDEGASWSWHNPLTYLYKWDQSQAVQNSVNETISNIYSLPYTCKSDSRLSLERKRIWKMRQNMFFNYIPPKENSHQ